AVLFLNEHIGWRRWCSILCGFLGVLLIVRPGAIAFDYSVLWAVLAMVALAVRDLTTPMVPRDMSSASLATFTMVGSLPFMIAWVWMRGESLFPPGVDWVVVTPMAVLGAIGYIVLIQSLRTADVSVVMPFRYSRIVFLIVLGVLVFGERPDAWTLLGAALVVGSGIYLMWREHRVKQSSTR
ncbi:MAG: DMT family transporter, partial [Pseudomonadota bacterium]